MNTRERQSGAVLVTSLIFLVVLTLVAVVAMQSTSLEQRMSANVAYKLQTFEDAESARSAIASVMYTHLYQKNTWEGMSIPDGLCLTGMDSSCALTGSEVNFFQQTAADGYETVSSNWDDSAKVGTYTAGGVNASIFVYRTHLQNLGGTSGIGQKAYNMGTGGGSSDAFYFDVRVRSTNPATGTTSTVAADYRYIRGLPPKDGIQ